MTRLTTLIFGFSTAIHVLAAPVPAPAAAAAQIFDTRQVAHHNNWVRDVPSSGLRTRGQRPGGVVGPADSDGKDKAERRGTGGGITGSARVGEEDFVQQEEVNQPGGVVGPANSNRRDNLERRGQVPGGVVGQASVDEEDLVQREEVNQPGGVVGPAVVEGEGGIDKRFIGGGGVVGSASLDNEKFAPRGTQGGVVGHAITGVVDEGQAERRDEFVGAAEPEVVTGGREDGKNDIVGGLVGNAQP